MPLTPTPEQQAIITAGKDTKSSLMVEAFAGCAKSTTAKMMLTAMEPGETLALAFNKKNKEDMERDLPQWVTVKTFNGLGHSALMGMVQGRVTLDDKKVGRLTSETLKQYGKASDEDWDIVRRMVSKAMQIGLVPKEFGINGLTPDNEGGWSEVSVLAEMFEEIQPWHVDAARKVLEQDIRQGHEGTICFDDQIYLPLFFGGRFRKYNRVLVDEAQDTMVLNHLQVGRSLLNTGSRLFVFGDSLQSIYQFRGAAQNSMNMMRNLREDWIDLKLSVTFRCPRELVKRQQYHAVGFTAAEQNADGRVYNWHVWDEEADSVKTWSWPDVLETRQNEETDTVAILCRNNAPLMSIAFKLIKQRVGVVMLGREIGKGLVALSKKLFKDDDTSAANCSERILEWMEQETAILRANGKEEKVAGITDRGECLLAVLEGGAKDAGTLRSRLTELFSKTFGQVTLSTGHKAKGLEWDTVLHLDPWKIPSKYAVKIGGSQLEQEKNLKYVIETRAKKVLILANLKQFEEEGK